MFFWIGLKTHKSGGRRVDFYSGLVICCMILVKQFLFCLGYTYTALFSESWTLLPELGQPRGTVNLNLCGIALFWTKYVLLSGKAYNQKLSTMLTKLPSFSWLEPDFCAILMKVGSVFKKEPKNTFEFVTRKIKESCCCPASDFSRIAWRTVLYSNYCYL